MLHLTLVSEQEFQNFDLSVSLALEHQKLVCSVVPFFMAHNHQHLAVTSVRVWHVYSLIKCNTVNTDLFLKADILRSGAQAWVLMWCQMAAGSVRVGKTLWKFVWCGVIVRELPSVVTFLWWACCVAWSESFFTAFSSAFPPQKSKTHKLAFLNSSAKKCAAAVGGSKVIQRLEWKRGRPPLRSSIHHPSIIIIRHLALFHHFAAPPTFLTARAPLRRMLMNSHSCCTNWTSCPFKDMWGHRNDSFHLKHPWSCSHGLRLNPFLLWWAF